MMTSSMETFSALLVFCAGNSPVTGEFPSQRPVTQSFDVFFDLRLNNDWVSNRDADDLRRHRANYDVTVMDRQCSHGDVMEKKRFPHTGPVWGKPSVTGVFYSQRISYAEHCWALLLPLLLHHWINNRVARGLETPWHITLMWRHRNVNIRFILCWNDVQVPNRKSIYRFIFLQAPAMWRRWGLMSLTLVSGTGSAYPLLFIPVVDVANIVLLAGRTSVMRSPGVSRAEPVMDALPSMFWLFKANYVGKWNGLFRCIQTCFNLRHTWQPNWYS